MDSLIQLFTKTIKINKLSFILIWFALVNLEALMLGSFTLPFFITTTSELLLRYFCFEPPLNVRKSLSAHFVYVSFCFEAKVIKFVKNPFYFS